MSLKTKFDSSPRSRGEVAGAERRSMGGNPRLKLVGQFLVENFPPSPANAGTSPRERGEEGSADCFT